MEEQLASWKILRSAAFLTQKQRKLGNNQNIYTFRKQILRNDSEKRYDFMTGPLKFKHDTELWRNSFRNKREDLEKRGWSWVFRAAQMTARPTGCEP